MRQHREGKGTQVVGQEHSKAEARCCATTFNSVRMSQPGSPSLAFALMRERSPGMTVFCCFRCVALLELRCVFAETVPLGPTRVHPNDRVICRCRRTGKAGLPVPKTRPRDARGRIRTGPKSVRHEPVSRLRHAPALPSCWDAH